jgi:hypothetical protein
MFAALEVSPFGSGKTEQATDGRYYPNPGENVTYWAS